MVQVALLISTRSRDYTSRKLASQKTRTRWKHLQCWVIEKMELQAAQKLALRSIYDITRTFQKLPGSAMLIRYIQSSYQHDPVRSAIELILVIFFIRYLLSPSYSTHNGNFVKLTEEVCVYTQRNTLVSNQQIRK